MDFIMGLFIFMILSVLGALVWAIYYIIVSNFEGKIGKIEKIFSLVLVLLIALLTTIYFIQDTRNTRAQIDETNVISIYQETTEVNDWFHHNTKIKEGHGNWIIKYYDKDTGEVKKFGGRLGTLEYIECKEKVTDDYNLLYTYDFSKFAKNGIVYKYISK